MYYFKKSARALKLDSFQNSKLYTFLEYKQSFKHHGEEDMKNDGIWKAFKTLRKKQHLTQDQVGALFSVAPSTVGAYERGTREPTMENLIKMANYFHVSLDYLLGQSDDERTLSQFQTVDYKELKDILQNQAILFNGGELTKDEKQRILDVSTGLFWQSIN